MAMGPKILRTSASFWLKKKPKQQMPRQTVLVVVAPLVGPLKYNEAHIRRAKTALEEKGWL